MKVEEFPPNLLRKVAGYELNGGKVTSISVNPKNRNEIIVATEYGGLWKTKNGGDNWQHVDNLSAVKVNDVKCGGDGTTIIATLERDNQIENGGGIWVSRDGGEIWSKPDMANPPKNERITDRISAYGISFSPDRPGTVYVGTDYGVATSNDFGEKWSHEMMEIPSHMIGRNQNSVFSILALRDDKVIAYCNTTAFFKESGSWRYLPYLAGYTGEIPPLKCAEIWPTDSGVLLTITKSSFNVYEISSSYRTGINLPTRSTLRFIRILKSVRKGAFDIVIGTSTGLLRASCRDLDELKKLKASSWIIYGESSGLYGDCAYIETDNNREPILLGSSAGVFKPESPEGFYWNPAATHGNGFNSFKITDLAGTNLPTPMGKYHTYLYFTTEDNGIWSSLDNGTSWPYCLKKSCFSLQAIEDAKSEGEITVAFGGNAGNTFSSVRFSELDARPISDYDKAGNILTPMSEVYLISPGNWIRYRLPVLNFGPDVYTSQDNGNNWVKKASVELEKIGGLNPSATVEGAVTNAYAAFRRPTSRSDDQPIFGLLKISDIFNPDILTYTKKDLILLPKDGSLGVRSTGEYSKVVIGVNPKDSQHIIAPDIYNQVVMVSKKGGDDWEPDKNLTYQVSKGQFLLSDGDPFHIQVTEISFDPYNDNRILVGTRDSGIIITNDGGINWQTVPDSEQITYVTGFFFTHNNTVIVSSYGRGLWQVDLTLGHGSPFDIYCRGGDCRILLPFDPHPPIYERDRWKHDDIIIFLNGRINGLALDQNNIKKVTVTEGTTYKRFPGESKNPIKVNILESSNGVGFQGLDGCLAAIQDGEIIKGIILRDNKIFGIISGKQEFREA
jgi:hypothetical protein